jgi:hypothetical protein
MFRVEEKAAQETSVKAGDKQSQEDRTLLKLLLFIRNIFGVTSYLE